MRLSIINVLYHGMAKIFSRGITTIMELLTIVVLFYQINEYISTEPFIILEVEQLETSSEYLLTGSASDKDYLLEYLKIYPDSNYSIKSVSFQYDHYKKEIILKENKTEKPNSYIISKTLLEQEYGKEGFRFYFLKNDRFKFNFKFDNKDTDHLPKFECQTVTLKQLVPCKVVEKGFVSYWRTIYAIILTMIVVFWFIRFFKLKNSPIFGDQRRSKSKPWGE
jgi:hypothetical protein